MDKYTFITPLGYEIEISYEYLKCERTGASWVEIDEAYYQPNDRNKFDVGFALSLFVETDDLEEEILQNHLTRL